MDADYQARRRKQLAKSTNVLTGFKAGAKRLATGIGSGIVGVVEKPLEGAEAGGVSGFAKGMGKGVVGAVAKPLGGLFDLGAGITEGIRNTADAATDDSKYSQADKYRTRPPRIVGPSLEVTVYEGVVAYGAMALRKLDAGKFERHAYLAHLSFAGRLGDGTDTTVYKQQVFISNVSLILAVNRKGAWSSAWQVALRDFVNAEVRPAGERARSSSVSTVGDAVRRRSSSSVPADLVDNALHVVYEAFSKRALVAHGSGSVRRERTLWLPNKRTTSWLQRVLVMAVAVSKRNASLEVRQLGSTTSHSVSDTTSVRFFQPGMGV